MEILNNKAIGSGAPEAPTGLTDPKLKNARFLVLRHSLIQLLTRSEVPKRARSESKRLVRFSAEHSALDSNGSPVPMPDSLLSAIRSQQITGACPCPS